MSYKQEIMKFLKQNKFSLDENKMEL